jgi:hypothetical protein
MATKSDILRQIIRGDGLVINVSAQNDLGVPIDLTGYTLFFTLRQCYDPSDETDTNAVLKKTWVSVGATTALSLTGTEMKLNPQIYKYDVQYVAPAGQPVTLVYGDFEVINETTNRSTI